MRVGKETRAALEAHGFIELVDAWFMRGNARLYTTEQACAYAGIKEQPQQEEDGDDDTGVVLRIFDTLHNKTPDSVADMYLPRRSNMEHAIELARILRSAKGKT